jgi:hypothetical protein
MRAASTGALWQVGGAGLQPASPAHTMPRAGAEITPLAAEQKTHQRPSLAVLWTFKPAGVDRREPSLDRAYQGRGSFFRRQKAPCRASGASKLPLYRL